MKRIWLLLVFGLLLCGCTSNEDRARDAIDDYLKRKGILVEQLKLYSVKPVNKTDYTKLMTKFILKDREPLNVKAMVVDGQIPDSLQRVIYNKRQLDKIYAQRIAEIRALVADKRDRDDFAFLVDVGCTYAVAQHEPRKMEMQFMFCRHKDIGLIFLDGPKWVRQRMLTGAAL